MPILSEIKHTKKNKYMWCACLGCGKERWVILIRGEKSTRCCHSCANIIYHREHPGAMAGEKNPAWRGGVRHHGDGYIAIKLNPDDFFFSMVGDGGYVKEHRLIMARHLNRCLLPWEVVHHKNGIRNDNRLENLELLPSAYQHNALSFITNYIRKLEKENEELKMTLKKIRKTQAI